jgi:DNA-binding transcriptional MerR regulator
VTTGEVAARLGVSSQRVRALDADLRPERCACGARRYAAASVEAFEAKRELGRAALSQARRERMRALRARRAP